ncbi:MAG: hypothetical protein C4522_19050 [Desulfobacteraceae bacterium]|nr:MAG: hypothetical protein C4522_19050 [Desulfobacteraceae bacterium]
MSNGSPENEKRKKAVFDKMSIRRQNHILKKGYDAWDPFEEPKDPIDMRKDKTRRTSQVLIREFLQSLPLDGYSNDFGRGAFDLCLGIVNKEDRYMGMYAFAVWHANLSKKEGFE